MPRSTQARLVIALCWVVLLVLAGRMAWVGVGMLREARQLQAGPAEAPGMGMADPQMMLFQQMVRDRWEQERAARLRAAQERRTAGWTLIGLGVILAAGWTVAAYLLWHSPRIVGVRAAPEGGRSAITSGRDGTGAGTDSDGPGQGRNPPV